MDGPKDLPNRSGDPRTTLAAQRTKLAKDEDVCGLDPHRVVGGRIGVALVKLLPTAEHRVLVQALGVLFVAAGMSILILAAKSYRDVVNRLEAQIEASVPVWVAFALTAVFLAGSAIGLVAIILD